MARDNQVDIMSAQFPPLREKAVNGRFEHSVHGEKIGRRRHNNHVRRPHPRENIRHVVLNHTFPALETGVARAAKADILII